MLGAEPPGYTSFVVRRGGKPIHAVCTGIWTFRTASHRPEWRTERLDDDARLKASVAETMPIYAYDPLISPHEEDVVDARAHHETWDDMVRLQGEGAYPAAFSAIGAPVLMVHGTFDPHPGRLIAEGLRRYLPQLEYQEFERCGHYPWLEKATANAFFTLVRDWLGKHMALSYGGVG